MDRMRALSTPTIAGLLHRYEPPFAIGDFGRCARGFDFVNRITLSRSPYGPSAVPPTFNAADERQDRTTAFAPLADLSLDADDGTVHRPPRHRRRAVFRYPVIGLVADRRRLRTRCLRQCAGLYRQLHRTPDRVRLHLGADASFAVGAPAFRLGPRLRLQGQ